MNYKCKVDFRFYAANVSDISKEDKIMGIVEEHWREFSETNRIINKNLRSINSGYKVIKGIEKFNTFNDKFGELFYNGASNYNIILDKIEDINACLAYHRLILDRLQEVPIVKGEDKKTEAIKNNENAIDTLKTLRWNYIKEIDSINNFTSETLKRENIGDDFKRDIDNYIGKQRERLNSYDAVHKNIYADTSLCIDESDWDYVTRINNKVAKKESNIKKLTRNFNTMKEGESLKVGDINVDKRELKVLIESEEEELKEIKEEFNNDYTPDMSSSIGNINADYSEFERNTNNRNEGAVIDGNDTEEIKKRINKLSREIEVTQNQRKKKNLTTIKNALQKVYERNKPQERASTSRIQSNRRPPTPKPTSGLPPKKPRRTSSLKPKKSQQTSNLPKYVELNDANTPPENERNTQADLGFTFNNHYETQGGINSHENIQNMKNMNGHPYYGIDHQGYDYYNDPYLNCAKPKKK